MKEINMTNIIGWGITLIIAFGGSWITQSQATNEKIELAKSEAYTANVAVVQRVASLEEAVSTLKKDSSEIKTDVKELLRILR